MQVSVIGAGYVGLVQAAVVAELGNHVVCQDIDAEKIKLIGSGCPPFYEPGLEEMLRRNLQEGRLEATTDLTQAARAVEIIFIAVGTPSLPDGQADLSQVEAAARKIGAALGQAQDSRQDPVIVAVKSTVPVGTGDRVRTLIAEAAPAEARFEVVSNPEFLRQGSAVQYALCPDRIVIGAPSYQAARKLVELYGPLERPMLLVDVRSAEMVKVACNSFLAMKISFVNSIADLCESSGADVAQVVKGMSYDSRIGGEFLSPGIGYGGSCFPKDTLALLCCAEQYGCDFKLLQAVIEVNRERVTKFVERMRRALGGLEGKQLGVLGLAFKAGTDDVREAKGIELIRQLEAQGAVVRAYDPMAIPNARPLLNGVRFCADPYQVVEGADALAIATEWPEFARLEMERIKAIMKRPVIFDGRNQLSPERMKRLGFEYHGIGR